jgi:hypothetical protein
MRQLKFRAWDLEIKKYRDNGTIQLSSYGDPFILITQKKGFLIESLENIKIELYTGLKDVNGLEIYGGDIIKWGMHGGIKGIEFPHRYAVVELNPDIQFKILYYLHPKTNEKLKSNNYVFNFGSFSYKDTEKYLEIVGNINEIK